MVSKQAKEVIVQVLNVFETGSKEGVYDSLVVYPDGHGESYQITYGRCQTTEQGNLATLIDAYVENEGRFAEEFVPYLERIGRVPLADDEGFKNLLRRAAREDPIMKTTQDAFFDAIYWKPAVEWFDAHGFKLPLSMLVVYDSFIHSGGILWFLRKRFSALPPSKGGDERRWIASYVDIRHQWLKYHSRALLRKTIYRTQTFLTEMERDNWALETLPINANGCLVP